jgi:ABC-type nitrate/sulfonate/bicarbonate transport system ATPase subunit
MTLTTVIGSSGSGKTTFLNDVHKLHKCTYIRQYHNLRPYIAVSKIPNFDPTSLPFWKIYEHEGKAGIIQVGGTMAGEFTAGLSGGQRKLLLFELIYQRTMNQKQLLLVFDEPFAGVTGKKDDGAECATSSAVHSFLTTYMFMTAQTISFHGLWIG